MLFPVTRQQEKTSPCVAFTLEEGVRGSVRVGSTWGGGPVRKRSRGCSVAPGTDGTVLLEWGCLGTQINHVKLLSSSLKPNLLSSMRALNQNPASFLAMNTEEAKLGRKEKDPFFISFLAYLLGMLRIYPYVESYYTEEYFIEVVIQGKYYLPVICISLYFTMWELAVAETHLRNGL